MNASFNPLHLVNTYGAFGSVTRVRHEVVVEGTDERRSRPRDASGASTSSRASPAIPAGVPPQVAPYHLRLDWMMWFAGISRDYGEPWLPTFLVKLLENDRPTIRLLRGHAFPGTPRPSSGPGSTGTASPPPRSAGRRGAWWVRTLVRRPGGRRRSRYARPGVRVAPARSAGVGVVHRVVGSLDEDVDVARAPRRRPRPGPQCPAQVLETAPDPGVDLVVQGVVL